MTEVLRTAAWRSAAALKRPATTAAAWPVRDEILTLHDIRLEHGTHLDTLEVHVRVEGTIAPARDNVVLIAHALTGTVRATEWWKGVVEVGGAIDPTRHAILTANLLGGCDGTAIPGGPPVPAPRITTRDQATVLARVLDALDIDAPLLVCGGSLGGQVTLEFAASFPHRVRSAVVLAAPAVQTAQGIAWNAIMRQAVAVGGPEQGLALARMVGMLSYRTPEGLEQRFGANRNERGIFRMQEWLGVHGDMLVARFAADSYVQLLDIMDSHDVGRGRGGVAAALAPVADRLIGVGIPGDLLYPAGSVQQWTEMAHTRYAELTSIHGHDAFLLEPTQVSAILRDAIRRAKVVTPSTSTAATNTQASAFASRLADRTATAQSPTLRPLRIALAGCGHVGGALLELLAGLPRAAERVQVERVLVRDKDRDRPGLDRAIAQGIAPADACCTDPAQLLTGEIDVLIEVIGGTATARSLVEAALARGIDVVTANKALLAIDGPALQALATTTGARLDFEAAVGGAIPIVRSIRSGAAGVGPTGIHGILNGTSNFVFDRLAQGDTLDAAVATAQALGYAEADPTRDLSGEDAEDKLRVLAWLLFGVDPRTLQVNRRGIDAETAAWTAQVVAEGDRVKLLASCSKDGDVVTATITPTRVTATDAWSQVVGPDNRIVITSLSAGALAFQGAGAGGRATAGAVLGDLLRDRPHAP
ncbi:MAG: homoserine dehydrogenase [Gemmatimonadaceae bacterium]